MTDNELKTILIVDDISSNIDLLKEMLSPLYQLKMVKKGADALKIVSAANKPDLILLDVMMPEMDGYEVCRRIKENPETAQIPVIFISTLSSAEEQILGFEAGANDYISKPVKKDDLMAKIHLAFELQKNQQQYSQDLNSAKKVAMTALQTLGEIGMVNKYFKNLASITSAEELAEQIVQFVNGFDLNSIIRIDTGVEDSVYRSSKGEVLPIEKSLISKLRNMGNIYDLKTGTVFNYNYISLLVIDMPVNNQDMYGRLKDHIAIVVGGSTGTVDSLISQKKLLRQVLQAQKQSDNLTKLITTVESVLNLIEKQQHDHKTDISKIMLDLVDGIESSFLSLGLSESQEENLLEQVNHANNQLNDLFDSNRKLEETIMMTKTLISLQ